MLCLKNDMHPKKLDFYSVVVLMTATLFFDIKNRPPNR